MAAEVVLQFRSDLEERLSRKKSQLGEAGFCVSEARDGTERRLLL
jgi:hypothetical protein